MHKVEGVNEIPNIFKEQFNTVQLVCSCGEMVCGYSVKDIFTAKKFAFEYWYRHRIGRKVEEVIEV